MACSIAALSLLVRDYDPAIAYYTRALGFRVLEDTPIDAGKRWVVLGPRSNKNSTGGASLLLARAVNARQRARIGNQSGGRVFLFLHTSRFWTDYRRMRSVGVAFSEEPRHEPYGWVVVFTDLYGNRWDLVQRPGRTRKPQQPKGSFRRGSV